MNVFKVLRKKQAIVAFYPYYDPARFEARINILDTLRSILQIAAYEANVYHIKLLLEFGKTGVDIMDLKMTIRRESLWWNRAWD
jgi:hypothetical protein